jgi:hypothetical protein
MCKDYVRVLNAIDFFQSHYCQNIRPLLGHSNRTKIPVHAKAPKIKIVHLYVSSCCKTRDPHKDTLGLNSG